MTDPDVTLVKEGLLKFPERQVFCHRLFNLRYLTSEKVPVKFKVRFKVSCKYE